MYDECSKNQIRYSSKTNDGKGAFFTKKLSKILDDEAVVAYATNGKALTSKEYNVRFKAAEKQIKSGKSVSQDELEREAENGLFL